ncbi:MAG: sigma-54-dependent Fis family transcriptional regulator [Leptonema sp. (in: Bacteria)]|nr:sigma-54-dependent Fis family transcriptional regulator [Leptonema sp. (in: bacteria)]
MQFFNFIRGRASPQLTQADLEQLLQTMQVIGHVYEDPHSFLAQIFEFIAKRFGFAKGGIVLTEANHPSIVVGDLKNQNQILANQPFTTRHRLSGSQFKQLTQLFRHCSGFTPDQIVTTNEPTDEMIENWKRYLAQLQSEGYVFFYPVFFQRELFAYLALGPKTNQNQSYTETDWFFLDFGSVSFSLAIRNAGIRIENSRLRLAELTINTESEKPVTTNPKIATEKATEIAIENRLLVFSDERMKATVERAAQIAGPNLPILIVGETGTGKELMARWIHSRSKKEGPFVPVNCSSIPATLWESELFGYSKGAFTDARENRAGLVDIAAGGTLFFDEIGEMPLEIQPKILRLLQEKTFLPVGGRQEKPALCRMVFATHRNLLSLVEAGQFRQDLYYRICVFEQYLLPLRERPTDIRVLFQHFLDRYAVDWQIEQAIAEPQLLARMQNYDWPGNVRELENFAARMALEYPGRMIPINSLPSYEEESVKQQQIVSAFDRKAIESLGLASGVTLDFESMMNNFAKKILTEALDRSHGNRSRAAEMLGISRGRLNYQIRQLGLE